MIGRIEEQKLLLSLLEEDEPQFVAVFGRRRIGKTYLVREVFQHRFTFQHTGVSNADLSPGTRKRNQLEKFKESLTEAGYNSPEKLKSWNDAFNGLKEVIRHSSERKKAIFKLYTGTKYAIHPTLITVYGLFSNAYAADIQAVITANDLFE